MKSISKSEKAEIYQKIEALQIERPHLLILEISNHRAIFLDELTDLEAETLLERLRKGIREHIVTIRQSA